MSDLMGLLVEIAIIAIVAYNWQLLLLRLSPPSSRPAKEDAGADLDGCATDAVQGSIASAASGGVLERPLSLSLANSIESIRAEDPSFKEAAFLEGASRAYELVLNAYAGGHIDQIRPLLDPAVANVFRRGVAERRERGEELELQFVGMKSAKIVAVWFEKRMAEITVRFVSEVVMANRNSSGVILQGDPRKIVETEDLWTFGRCIRSTNPNWTLLATEGAEPGPRGFKNLTTQPVPISRAQQANGKDVNLSSPDS